MEGVNMSKTDFVKLPKGKVLDSPSGRGKATLTKKTTVIREQFDYTKWHRELADKTTKEQFHEWALENEKKDPSTII